VFLEHRLNNVNAGHFTVGTVVKLLTGYKNKMSDAHTAEMKGY